MTYKKGDEVEVFTDGDWVKAKVLRVELIATNSITYYVHPVGVWGFWVGVCEIRRRDAITLLAELA